jgi:uncharacterized protein YdcH (DUF465 family)
MKNLFKEFFEAIKRVQENRAEAIVRNQGLYWRPLTDEEVNNLKKDRVKSK